MSSHNPFRALLSTEPPSNPPVVSTPPDPPPSFTTDSARDRDFTLPRDSDDLISSGLNEELPPAYTAAADERGGEFTVDAGPRRPFQPSPSELLARQHLTGQRRPQPASRRAVSPPLPSPPRPSSAGPETPAWARNSEFARDFYAAGAASPAATTSRTSPPPSRFAPPPGRPPTTDRPPTTTTPSAGHVVPNDGRPTHIPLPGHPYLYNNQILIYPAGFTCEKCYNTGYKHLDTAKPCRKCWPRYGRLFTGAITYTTWSTDGSATMVSSSRTTFQKPLPGRSAASSSINPTPHRPAFQSHTSDRSLPNPSPHSRSVSSVSAAPPRVVVTDPYTRPPPGALVVQPGDSRLGGRLCYNCGGTGTVSFFLFDQMTCDMCRGVGRTGR